MKTLHVVHLIDTEGPLYESFNAHFERVYEIFGHKIEATRDNLAKLKSGSMDLSGDEEKIKELLSDSRISMNSTWDQIDRMLDIITTEKYRKQITDSFGSGWIYNWMCMSHVGFTGNNPRRRDIGYFNIYDHFKEYLDSNNDTNDLLQWHYHALSLTNDANRAGSTYLNSSHIYDILSRGIIDKLWFPTVFRAGHNTIRPDSHWFLEQWIPFDYSNARIKQGFNHNSLSRERYGDWHDAPASWVPYQPSHANHKVIGNCNRFIARCLSIDDRGYSIQKEDIIDAFEEASSRGNAIFAVTNHDFRNMQPDIDQIRNQLQEVSVDYPDVKIKYSNAIDAMRATLNLDSGNKPGLKAEIIEIGNYKKLIVHAESNLFGPQPYLAIKTKNNDYFWQNFDFVDTKSWSYSFDIDNLLIEQVSKIGIAANSNSGVTEIIKIDPHLNVTSKHILNS